MANLRLYREIFLIDSTGTYNLINPFGLSASTYVVSSSTLIETINVSNESLGIFYVDLNPILYASDLIYELRWSVQYVSVAPIKILPTRFRLNPYNISSGPTIEIVSLGSVEIELSSKPIQIEIL